MKIFIVFAFILLQTSQLNAETYSWVDDSGTYNFTEEYSNVPKKYRKKVKIRDDIQQDAAPEVSNSPDKPAKQAEGTDAKSAVGAGDGKDQYGGKSYAEWRKELDVREAELSGIEQRMEQLRKQIKESKGVTRDQLEVLVKEHDDNQATYQEKYKNYTELVETIRKTGITVEIRK